MSMNFQTLYELILLLGLGLAGWFLLSKLRVPAAPILGPILLIGILRAGQVNLPPSPDFIFPAAQVVIGIFVGSMLNRETLNELKELAISASIIIIWTLSIALGIGFLLAHFSVMDLHTAILSSSMGGLPEITVLALATGADTAIIILMQLIRMVGTVLLFPVLLNWLETKNMSRSSSLEQAVPLNQERQEPVIGKKKPIQTLHTAALTNRNTGRQLRGKALSNGLRTIRQSWKRGFLTLVVAAGGGLMLESFGVPAGMMVGSTMFVAAASILGLPISRLPRSLLDILLVFIGIAVADNITVETVAAIADTAFLIPILIASAVMFATSLAVAFGIHRFTGWDFPTSFMAAAPAGFTVMTTLAVKHGLNPIKVSMLHLCRLLSIKMVIPFVFMALL